MEGDVKPYSLTRKLMSIFDIMLALIIIVCSSTVLRDPLGGVCLIFGISMLTIVTVLKIFQRW